MKTLQKFIDKIRRKNKKILICGKNNLISGLSKKSKIVIYGNNNVIDIKSAEGVYVNIFLGATDCPVDNCRVIIGEKSTIQNACIFIGEDNSEVSIGSDCMFSYNINIFCSDTHSLLDNSGKVCNVGKFVKIGNHVWCGMGTCFLKNTMIADGSVVGMNSVVTKIFDERNIVVAGNPAKVVKKEINWDRKRPKQLIKTPEG